MADVSVDSSISTSTARGQRAVVFVTPTIGYLVCIDSDGTFGYRKTLDGGATWGAEVVISSETTNIAFDIWYDQWTSGDTGTRIHLVWFDTNLDDVFYRALETNGDTFVAAAVVVEAETSAAVGVGVHCSITKSRGGKLYIAWECDVSAERGFRRSTDGVTWTSSAAVEEATGDVARLFPANLADANDIWALFHDVSADALTLKTYDDSANTWSESATIATIVENTTDLTSQFHFSGSVRHSDGHLIVVVDTERDSATADRRVFDITNESTITEKTAITTNIDDTYYSQVFIDQLNNHIYVAYNGKNDGTEVLGTTTHIYYQKSTDGGTSWAAAVQYSEGATTAKLQTFAPLMGPLFYVTWRVGTTLVGNAVNSIRMTVAGTSFTDAFTRTNSPHLGPNWLEPWTSQLGGDFNGHGRVLSNEATITLGSTGFGVLMNVVLANDQFAESVIRIEGAANNIFLALIIREQNTLLRNYYEFTAARNTTLGDTSYINKVVDNVGTNLVTPSAAEAWATGDVLRAEIKGNELRLYRNGLLVLSTTDNTFSSGRTGCGGYAECATGDIGATIGHQSFEAGGIFSSLSPSRSHHQPRFLSRRRFR